MTWAAPRRHGSKVWRRGPSRAQANGGLCVLSPCRGRRSPRGYRARRRCPGGSERLGVPRASLRPSPACRLSTSRLPARSSPSCQRVRSSGTSQPMVASLSPRATPAAASSSRTALQERATSSRRWQSTCRRSCIRRSRRPRWSPRSLRTGWRLHSASPPSSTSVMPRPSCEPSRGPTLPGHRPLLRCCAQHCRPCAPSQGASASGTSLETATKRRTA